MTTGGINLPQHALTCVRFHFFSVVFLGFAFFSSLVRAADVTIQSGAGRTSLLELFTSEGCSSCPPAEAWFSKLRQSPRLWRDVVPVSFHVNYWDSLGWKDSFATQEATNRQRTYAAAWGSDTVYTPGFVLNGSEWRDRNLDSIPASTADAGKLSATLQEDGKLRVTFQPAGNLSAKWQAHAALLGFGMGSDVEAGENSGRRLIHDFVVLSFASSGMDGEVPAAQLHLPLEKLKRGQSALAVWITEENGTEPVQASGGNL